MLAVVTFDGARWWSESGGAWLTGRADGPPLRPAADVGGYVVDALRAIDTTAAGDVDDDRLGQRAAALLFGRAAFTRAHRDGPIATGGTARLVPAADGWVAVNLARPADLASVGAIIAGDDQGDPFAAFGAFARERPATEVAARTQLFGVPCAVVGATGAARAVVRTPIGGADERRSLRVLDLTALWAGPTCARLLGESGAHVVKVESTSRPDGARRGNAAFYAWLHRFEAAATVFDFDTAEGLSALRAELDNADVVLESSRPRALRHLGIVAEEWLSARPGRVWLSITGYGRDEPDPGRVAFGDDAAAAGGLVAFGGDDATPLFVGDAIADPLTGIAAARAIQESLQQGGGELISVALAGVAARVMAAAPGPPGEVPGAVRPQVPTADI